MGAGYPALGMGWVGVAGATGLWLGRGCSSVGRGWVGVARTWVRVGCGVPSGVAIFITYIKVIIYPSKYSKM